MQVGIMLKPILPKCHIREVSYVERDVDLFPHYQNHGQCYLRHARTATGSVGSWSEQSLAASALQAFAARTQQALSHNRQG